MARRITQLQIWQKLLLAESNLQWSFPGDTKEEKPLPALTELVERNLRTTLDLIDESKYFDLEGNATETVFFAKEVSFLIFTIVFGFVITFVLCYVCWINWELCGKGTGQTGMGSFPADLNCQTIASYTNFLLISYAPSHHSIIQLVKSCCSWAGFESLLNNSHTGFKVLSEAWLIVWNEGREDLFSIESDASFRSFYPRKLLNALAITESIIHSGETNFLFLNLQRNEKLKHRNFCLCLGCCVSFCNCSVVASTMFLPSRYTWAGISDLGQPDGNLISRTWRPYLWSILRTGRPPHRVVLSHSSNSTNRIKPLALPLRCQMWTVRINLLCCNQSSCAPRVAFAFKKRWVWVVSWNQKKRVLKP